MHKFASKVSLATDLKLVGSLQWHKLGRNSFDFLLGIQIVLFFLVVLKFKVRSIRRMYSCVAFVLIQLNCFDIEFLGQLSNCLKLFIFVTLEVQIWTEIKGMWFPEKPFLEKSSIAGSRSAECTVMLLFASFTFLFDSGLQLQSKSALSVEAKLAA